MAQQRDEGHEGPHAYCRQPRPDDVALFGALQGLVVVGAVSW
jgi:hypothetical protein